MTTTASRAVQVPGQRGRGVFRLAAVDAAAPAVPVLGRPITLDLPHWRAPRRLHWALMVVELLVGLSMVVALGLGPASALVPAAWVLATVATDGYRRTILQESGARLRTPVTVGAGLILAVESAVWFLPELPVRSLLLVVVALMVTGLCGRLVAQSARRSRGAPLRVLMLGGRSDIDRALEQMREHGGDDLAVVGACPLDAPGRAGGQPGSPWAALSELPRAVEAGSPDLVLAVPGPELDAEQIRRVGWLLESSRAELCLVSGISAVAPARTKVAAAGSMSLIHLRRTRLHGTRRAVKDLWERLAALAALILLAPVLGLLVVLIRLDSPGPAVFRQERVGRGQRRFTMLKLRTMADGADKRLDQVADLNEADGALFKVRADPRVTRLGQFLRRYSIDEVPQLWNVVRGDMALVGPRPPLPGEVARYDHDTRRRLAVKPGLTGLWQVSGRSDLPWHEAVRLDLHYVDNWSLGLDLTIVLRTFGAVLSHRGAY